MRSVRLHEYVCMRSVSIQCVFMRSGVSTRECVHEECAYTSVCA